MLIELVRKALRLTKRAFPLVWTARALSSMARRLSSFIHWFQFNVEWGVDNPEYFDHHLDIHYQWRKTGNSLPMERGVHNSLAIKRGGRVLDLACGDGFFTSYFYAIHAREIIGVDFDKSALKLARQNRIFPNTRFLLADIRNELPEGPFDNIVWDAAIEHFTEPEIIGLMGQIKSRLSKDGILSGYTVTEAEHGEKHLHQHEYEFHDKQDLARFLKPHFKNVHVYESDFPTRTNLYFYASDAKLPLRSNRHLVIED